MYGFWTWKLFLVPLRSGLKTMMSWLGSCHFRVHVNVLPGVSIVSTTWDSQLFFTVTHFTNVEAEIKISQLPRLMVVSDGIWLWIHIAWIRSVLFPCSLTINMLITQYMLGKSESETKWCFQSVDGVISTEDCHHHIFYISILWFYQLLSGGPVWCYPRFYETGKGQSHYGRSYWFSPKAALNL